MFLTSTGTSPPVSGKTGMFPAADKSRLGWLSTKPGYANMEGFVPRFELDDKSRGLGSTGSVLGSELWEVVFMWYGAGDSLLGSSFVGFFLFLPLQVISPLGSLKEQNTFTHFDFEIFDCGSVLT